MFGGWAVYKNGVIFAIIVDGELYGKVDDSNRAEFEEMESHPFAYMGGRKKPIAMSYWLIPDEIMEDRERFSDLIEKSVAVSRKKNRGEAPRGPFRTPPA